MKVQNGARGVAALLIDVRLETCAAAYYTGRLKWRTTFTRPMQRSLKPYSELSEEKKAEVIQLLAKALGRHSEIVFSYTHGSFVELERFRDVDVAVYCEDATDGRDVLEYELGVSSELEEIVGLPVDVRVLNHAPLGFRYYVTRGRVLTSRDEELRCTFVEKVWTEYLDYAPKAKEFFRDLVAPLTR